MSKVWFITGASRGFGRAYAEEAVAHGDFVVATMRTVRTDDAFLQDEHVLPCLLYTSSKAFNSGEFGYAAALSFIVAVTLIFLAILQFKAMRNRDAA